MFFFSWELRADCEIVYVILTDKCNPQTTTPLLMAYVRIMPTFYILHVHVLNYVDKQ